MRSFRPSRSRAAAIGIVTAALVGSATVAFAVTGIANGDFETGAPGDTEISGWTAVKERIDLGVDTIAGCATVDTSDYTTLRDWAIEYDDNYGDWNEVEYEVDVNGDRLYDGNGDPIPKLDGDGNTIPVPAPLDPDPSVNNDSAETLEDEEYSVTLRDGNVLGNTDFRRNSQVLELYSDVGGTNADGYVVHGPAVYSEVFAAKPIDDLAVDWAASDDSDDYHVLGYLLNVDTCQQTEVIDSTGQSSLWQTARVAVPSAGNYRFVFVSGTFDQSFGGAAGAFLFLDGASLVVNTERAAEAAAAEAAAASVNDAAKSQEKTGNLAYSGPEAKDLPTIAAMALVLGTIVLFLRRQMILPEED